MRKYMIDLVRSFLNGTNAQAATARVEDGVFYSYSTPIAINHEGKIFLTLEKFSKTTTTQQNALLQSIPENRLNTCSAEQIKQMLLRY